MSRTPVPHVPICPLIFGRFLVQTLHTATRLGHIKHTPPHHPSHGHSQPSMTIGRSPTSTKSMVVTPPRRRKEWHHDTLVSLRSLALSMSTLKHDDDDGTTTKFRLAPRYHHTDGQYYHHHCQKLPHCINDDSIQSPAVRRRYLRRGSRTPSMLGHVALLETLTAAATLDPEPSEEERNTNDSHHDHHNNNVVTLRDQFRRDALPIVSVCNHHHPTITTPTNNNDSR